MNKIKIIISFIVKGIKLIIKMATSNKITIKKNKRTRIIKNEITDMNLSIQRNDECEITENKFIKK